MRPISPTETVLSRLLKAKRNGDGWRVRCPAHDGKSADSLAISEGDDGAALLFCHGGCETAAICSAIGIETRDLFVKEDRGQKRPASKPKPTTIYRTANAAIAELERRHSKRSALWTYHDGNGDPMGCVVRWDLSNGDKEIRPITRVGSGWACCGMSSPRPLYGLPDLADADRVFVCEGEKAADAARSLGVIATTSPHGSKSAGKADWQPLADKEVVILPDHDSAGSKYANAVIGCLSKLKNPPTIKVVELPDLPEAGDAADWVASGGTRDQLDHLVEQTQERELEVGTGESKAEGDDATWLPSITWMDGVQERKWDWLWPDKIPLGAFGVVSRRRRRGEELGLH